jgi:hypothetical protein
MPAFPDPHDPSPGKIIQQEQRALTSEEARILSRIRDKKIVHIASTYLVLSFILVFAWLYGWTKTFGMKEEDAGAFDVVGPLVILFLFITLTIFFVNYYLKAVRPFVRDLKAGYKELIFFEPESYKTPFFDAYYIKTPSKKNAVIRISKEFYDSIKPGCKACLCLTPHARFPFSIDVDGKRIEFNEKNTRVDT